MNATRIAVALGLLVAADAAADIDVPRADALFAEAQALKETNLLQACAKFDESLALNPQAIGTLINVALCEEKLGRVASAVARFAEARDRAIEGSLPAYQKAAEEHLATLAGEVPHVAITLAESATVGIRVLVDNHAVELASLAALPVDPGERVITVSAPGRVTFETKLVIARGESLTVSVPALRAAVIVRSARRSIGRFTVAGGVVAIGTGVVLGLVARHRYRALFPAYCVHTDAGSFCDPDHQDDASSAHTMGNVGTAVGVLGLGAIAVGTILWLTAPSSRADPTQTEHARVVLLLDPTTAGVAAVGHF